MADRTASTLFVPVPRSAVMSVISDFAAYPEWAGVSSAEVIGPADGAGRARLVRFGLDAGIVRDRFALRYEWDGDEQVRWEIAEPGTIITAMSGSYALRDRAGGTDVTFELAVAARIPLTGLLRRRIEKAIIAAALAGLRTRAQAPQPGS
ncbi:MAG: SRPBCC family protein [Streptosporangiaceae bacterium]